MLGPGIQKWGYFLYQRKLVKTFHAYHIIWHRISLKLFVCEKYKTKTFHQTEQACKASPITEYENNKDSNGERSRPRLLNGQKSLTGFSYLS